MLQLINKSQNQTKKQFKYTYVCTLDFLVNILLYFANVSEGGRNMSYLCLLIANHLVVFVFVSFFRFFGNDCEFSTSAAKP